MGALTLLGWALALVLVLALAALALPACLSLDWRAGQLTVRARLFCFVFRLWPPRPKTPRQLARQAKRDAARAEKKERKQAQKAEKQRKKAEKARQKAEKARAAQKSPGARKSGEPGQAKSETTAGPASAHQAEGKADTAKETKKADTAAAKSEKAAGAKGGKKAAPKKGLAENLRRLSCLVSRAGWLGKKLLRAVKVRHILLVVPVQGETAAATAWQYGGLWAGLSASLGILQRGMDLRFDRLELLPDFAGLQEGGEVLSCKIQARLIIMIAAGLYTLYGLYRDRVF